MSEVKVVSFNGLMKPNIRNDKLPSSADCFFIGDDVTFVEFKKWYHRPFPEDDDPQRDLKRRIDLLKMKEMEKSIQVKAADSISIYNRFIRCRDIGSGRTRFILVDDSPGSRIGSVMKLHDNGQNTKFLRMFQCKDGNGTPVFHDEVLGSSPDSFIKLMGRENMVFPPRSVS